MENNTLRQIRANYSDTTIRVYQAYSHGIADAALAQQTFVSPPFKMERMTWIKPSFLWMMYRSGWGTKEGQEITLAVTIPRRLFDEMLASAVPSAFSPDRHSTEKEWKTALAGSEVRLQWDPDHSPDGAPYKRRAVQLGLRGEMLQRYAVTEVLHI